MIATDIAALVAELRDLPEGLDTPIRAGCAVVDTLRALGYGDVMIESLTGIDPRALEGEVVEVARV